MNEERPGRFAVTLPPLMGNATALLAAGLEALAGGDQDFDFAGVAEADSSILAVMLGWLRAADQSGRRVRFANIPAGARSLAELYGISELLPLV